MDTRPNPIKQGFIHNELHSTYNSYLTQKFLVSPYLQLKQQINFEISIDL